MLKKVPESRKNLTAHHFITVSIVTTPFFCLLPTPSPSVAAAKEFFSDGWVKAGKMGHLGIHAINKCIILSWIFVSSCVVIVRIYVMK